VPGSLKWKVTLGFNVGPPVIGDDGTTYVPHSYDSGYLSAIDPSGNVKWSYDTGWWVSRYWCAVGGDGNVYIESNNGIEAINSNGTQKWSFDTRDPHLPSDQMFYKYYLAPCIASNGNIYLVESRWTYGMDDFDPQLWVVVDWTTRLLCLTPEGKLNWSVDTTQWHDPTNLVSEPIIGLDGTVYTYGYWYWGDKPNTMVGKVYAINPDGEVKWSQKLDFLTSYPHPSFSVGIDGTIYVTLKPRNPPNESNKLYALNPNGTLKWSFDQSLHETWFIGSPIIGQEHIYIIESGAYQNIHSINTDATLQWSRHVDYILIDTAVGSDGTIYLDAWKYPNESRLYALNPDGSLLWICGYPARRPNYHPMCIGDDGTIYVSDGNDSIYAIEGETREAPTAPWPMLGHDRRRTARAVCDLELLVVIPGINTEGPNMVGGGKILLGCEDEEDCLVEEIAEVDNLSDEVIRENLSGLFLEAKQVGADVIVNIDMDLEDYSWWWEYWLPGWMNRWHTSTAWAGRVANITAEAFREMCTDGTCRLYAHSAGVDATTSSITRNAGQSLYC
jgi:hypothetical protein